MSIAQGSGRTTIALGAGLWLACVCPVVRGQECGTQTARLTRPAAEDSDFFGRSVAVGPAGLAVGAPSAGANGTVEFFRRQGDGWAHVQSLAPGAGSNDWYGDFIAMSGGVLVVGCEFCDPGGLAYVYRYNGATWDFEQTLAPGDGQSGDEFGLSVAVDGARILVGASRHGVSGAAYVFEHDGSAWVQSQKLTPSNGGSGDEFGFNVSLAGNVAAVSAYRHDGQASDAGAAYVFRHDGSQFVEEARLIGSDAAAGDRGGVGLYTDGSRVVLGAIRHDLNEGNEGAAYVFAWDGSSWVQEQKLIASDPGAGHNFGVATHVRGDRVLVGSYDDDNGVGSGSVYVFTRSGGAWAETDKLLATDGLHSGWFGWAMASDGELVVVGAHTSDGDAGFAPGAAFVFECPDDTDTDGDGLLDRWEREGGGIDANGDGVIDLDLYALGARPDHKDLFLEVDVMDGGSFSQAGLDMVIDSFRFSPVENPDGEPGINLHVFVDELDIPYAQVWDDEFADYDNAKAFYFGTPTERASPNAQHILAAKRRALRYAIVVDEIADETLGIAELPGNDMYIGMGSLSAANITALRPFEWWFAHVFMHELGHMLGLEHGGGTDLDPDNPGQEKVINYKPNYVSVMNYNFDFVALDDGNGSRIAPPITYSAESLTPLDESNLDESIGISSPSLYYTDYWVPFTVNRGDGSKIKSWLKIDEVGSAEADYNGDGDATDTGVVADLNEDWTGDTPGETMHGHNDWANIQYAIGEGGAWDDYVHFPLAEPELSNTMATAHRESMPPPPFGCRADTNQDGVVDTRDVIEFLNLYTSGKGAADYTLDGVVDSRDVLAFLNDWIAKC